MTTLFCISYLIIDILSIYMVTAERRDCVNDWTEITDSCINTHSYYYPTVSIQTWSDSDFPKISSYSSVSVAIKGNNKNLIITPHCISFKHNNSSLSIDNLINEWMSESISWPLYHSQGNIITFNYENISQFIKFTEPCHIKKNHINALILIFSHNFNAYHIETTPCNKMDGITMYHHLITNKNDQNCSLSMRRSNNWNFQLLPTITSDLSTPTHGNGKINAILSWIVYTLTLILFCNAIWCILMFCYNQKKLKQIKFEESSNVNTPTSSNSKPKTSIISLFPSLHDLDIDINADKLPFVEYDEKELCLDMEEYENIENKYSLSSFPTIPQLKSTRTDNLDGFIFINDNYSKDNKSNTQCISNITDITTNMSGNDDDEELDSMKCILPTSNGTLTIKNNDSCNKLPVSINNRSENVANSGLNSSAFSTITAKNITSNNSSMSSFMLTPIQISEYQPNLKQNMYVAHIIKMRAI